VDGNWEVPQRLPTLEIYVDIERQIYCTSIFLIRIVGVEFKLGPLGTSATSGLLYMPWVIVRMENLVE
jgi:hypothetical protein